jgi:hypothetical protein
LGNNRGDLLCRVWFWIFWEVAAGALVAIGCFGEWYLFKTPATSGNEAHHRNKELRFIFVVAIGVTMELCGLAHTIPEAMRLEKEAANARKEAGDAKKQAAESNERSKQLELTRVKLEKQVAELEIKLQRRRLTKDQQDKAVSLLRPLSKAGESISIGFSSEDSDSTAYAEDFAKMFSDSGYIVTKEPAVHLVVVGFPQEGVSISVCTNPPPKTAVAMQQAITEAKINVLWFGLAKPPKQSDFFMFVGKKPPPE